MTYHQTYSKQQVDLEFLENREVLVDLVDLEFPETREDQADQVDQPQDLADSYDDDVEDCDELEQLEELENFGGLEQLEEQWHVHDDPQELEHLVRLIYANQHKTQLVEQSTV